MCVGGINPSDLPNSNNQIIICKSYLTGKLLVRECHKNNFHISREHALATIRKKICIPACRGLIRKVLYDCLYCKKEQIKPHIPLMSDLPQERLGINEKPFQNTGIDFFGPTLVKLSNNTQVNQTKAKRYGAIFIFMTIPAVNLETANELTSDSFILSLHRFIACCGNVKNFQSDNGTNFIGTEKGT